MRVEAGSEAQNDYNALCAIIMRMFSTDADLFFSPPRTALSIPGWFGVLYLLRRDIDLCMGVNPATGDAVSDTALWPGTMAVLAGIDLLAKFFAGSDDLGKVGDRFRSFLEHFFSTTKPVDRDVIYHLRNSLLHSFGLYSKDKNNVYHFFLTATGNGQLVSQKPPDEYYVDLRILHREFEKAVEAYRTELDRDLGLQAHFTAMFGNYGRIYIK
jgi:hypothetical protein